VVPSSSWDPPSSQEWPPCAASDYKGADLAYVFAYKDAAIPIKAMSPDLIVLPLLPLTDYEAKQRFQHFIKFATSVVIGPGLGRDMTILKEMPFMFDCLANKSVICDADFFWFLAQDPVGIKKSLKGPKRVILTPNVAEFGRLVKLATGKEFDADGFSKFLDGLGKSGSEFETVDIFEQVPEVKKTWEFFDNPKIVLLIKHRFDLIVTKNTAVVLTIPGSRKRCGGMGDLLTGMLAQFVQLADQGESDVVDALALGCYLLKKSAAEASRERPISLIASDVLAELPKQVALASQWDEKSDNKSDFYEVE